MTYTSTARDSNAKGKPTVPPPLDIEALVALSGQAGPPLTAAAMGGVAGGTGGCGVGAAIGMIAGPPGAAVGAMVGLVVGMIADGAGAGTLAHKLNARRRDG